MPFARYTSSACEIALAQIGTTSSGSIWSSSAGCRYNADISDYK